MSASYGMVRPMETTDFMALALQQAEQAGTADEVPIGAVIICDGKVIAAAHNRVEEWQDATAHAELVAIRAAMEAVGNKRLPDCEIFVSLEPCTMCAGAISLARLKRVTFAAADPKGGALWHGAKFFEQPTCHHRPEVIQDKNHEAVSGDLLRSFFAEKRLKASV